MSLLAAIPPALPSLAAMPPALLPLAAAVVVAVAPRRLGHAAGIVAAAAVVPLALAAPPGTRLAGTLFGFDVIFFAVDGYSRIVGAVFGFVAAANVLYGYGVGSERATTATAVAYVGASLGAVFAGDWLTLVICWELMAAAATVLLWRSPAAARAGYRYALYHQLGGALLIAGVLAHYVAAGTFLYGGGIAAGLPRLLAALGVGVNVGVLGVHVWLIDAYPRPDVATSAVLCGFTTKVGVYALVRVFPGRNLALAYLGAAMLVFGVTMAILQTDLRRLLSYHIVSQVGYMVAGIGIATPLGYGGAMAHLANNVLYKTLLFMIGGAIVLGTGRESLKRLGGLDRSMPATAGAFAVAALAIAGIPGFAGFVSKGMIVDAADRAGLRTLWWLLLAGGVGTVVSFAKVGYYAFLRDAPDDLRVETVGRPTAGALAALALPCVAFGVAPDLLLGLVPTGAAEAKVFAGSQFPKVGAVTLAGLMGFLAIREPLSRVTPVPDLDAAYHPAGARLRDGVVRSLGTIGDAAAEFGTAIAERSWRVAGGGSTADRSGTDTVGRGLLLLTVAAALIVLVLGVAALALP
jgi:multicomponent Na+:H+ antiporter subunit D